MSCCLYSETTISRFFKAHETAALAKDWQEHHKEGPDMIFNFLGPYEVLTRHDLKVGRQSKQVHKCQ